MGSKKFIGFMIIAQDDGCNCDEGYHNFYPQIETNDYSQGYGHSETVWIPKDQPDLQTYHDTGSILLCDDERSVRKLSLKDENQNVLLGHCPVFLELENENFIEENWPQWNKSGKSHFRIQYLKNKSGIHVFSLESRHYYPVVYIKNARELQGSPSQLIFSEDLQLDMLYEKQRKFALVDQKNRFACIVPISQEDSKKDYVISIKDAQEFLSYEPDKIWDIAYDIDKNIFMSEKYLNADQKSCKKISAEIKHDTKDGQFHIVEKKLSGADSEYQKLQNSYLKLREEYDQLNTNFIAQKNANDDLQRENVRLKNAGLEVLEELYREKTNVLQEDYNRYAAQVENVKTELDKKGNELNEKSDELEILRQDVESAKMRLSGVVDEILSKENIEKRIAEKKIEPFLFSEIRRSGTGESNIAELVQAFRGKEYSGEEGDALVELLIKRFGKCREGYDDDMIRNILLCTSQGFLTIFAGSPGTGKTSLCKILAKITGLSDYSPEIETDLRKERFVQLPVERGWTSKRDLIGYYNPLTKTFDRSNSMLFDGIQCLSYEAAHTDGQDRDLPFIVLMDEANLSPMEHYWESFMNICDDIFDGKAAQINLGEHFIFQIPEHLRFFATINNDHTTEALSPRLIDRAWVIRLPHDVKPGDKDVEEVFQPIPWVQLRNTFCVSDEEVKNDGKLKDAFKECADLLESDLVSKTISSVLDTDISPRIKKAIMKYCVGAVHIGMELPKAKDYAIAQRILPHIKGYGADFGKQLSELSGEFGRNKMTVCKGLIDEILETGKRNRQFFQFFG